MNNIRGAVEVVQINDKVMGNQLIWYGYMYNGDLERLH